MRRSNMEKPVRGEIWEVNFSPSIGAEIQKVRPAALLNVPEVGRLPLVIVVPITEWQPAFAQHPWFTKLSPTRDNGLSKESGADAFQVKSISVQRLVRRLGHLTEDETDSIGEGIALCVGV
jgi:mRNA interferase MazF